MLERITPVVKNLLIINVLVYIAQQAIPYPELPGGITEYLGIHYFDSADFMPVQIVTNMFMHGSIMHLMFNMYGVFLFGSAIESRLGSAKFLQYFLFCGLGAVLLHVGVNALSVYNLTGGFTIDPELAKQFAEVRRDGMMFTDPDTNKLFGQYISYAIGASGALFGLLFAFGRMFPNVELMLLFFPVPIKAKYFVAGYAAIELFAGVTRIPGDNIAHFAHLGGMLFGYLFLKFAGGSKFQQW
ncbi:MAG: membrane associated rhomboid family serine protease [Limisphaerales bacterium]|jgi:membrane associated rhomboid family serine protease